MLFLLFQLGADWYAIEARRVVEVVPLLAIQRLAQAPRGVAGFFNYRGRPVPAVDLCELTVGRPANERLSTRILIIQYPDAGAGPHLLGLVAENATSLMQRDPREFVDPGLRTPAAPYLGPVLIHGQSPVRWVQAQRLLPEPVRQALYAELEAIERCET